MTTILSVAELYPVAEPVEATSSIESVGAFVFEFAQTFQVSKHRPQEHVAAL